MSFVSTIEICYTEICYIEIFVFKGSEDGYPRIPHEREVAYQKNSPYISWEIFQEMISLIKHDNVSKSYDLVKLVFQYL